MSPAVPSCFKSYSKKSRWAFERSKYYKHQEIGSKHVSTSILRLKLRLDTKKWLKNKCRHQEMAQKQVSTPRNSLKTRLHIKKWLKNLKNMCQTPQNAQNSQKRLKKAIRIVKYTRTKIQLGTGDTGDTFLPLSFIPLSPSLQFKNFRPSLELGTPFCPYK